ncbi:hypothetical protein H4Q26_009849 [Puccinia striiformis f. sp. tritici PST-130]|nr:hypothetical protein H4Q26_009849 [Puccinia striiformis f. sp. tritici PST-130]
MILIPSPLLSKPGKHQLAGMLQYYYEPNSNHRDGKGYMRTLKLEHLINNIQAVNTGSQPPPPPGSLSSLLNISNDRDKIEGNGEFSWCLFWQEILRKIYDLPVCQELMMCIEQRPTVAISSI